MTSAYDVGVSGKRPHEQTIVWPFRSSSTRVTQTLILVGTATWAASWYWLSFYADAPKRTDAKAAYITGTDEDVATFIILNLSKLYLLCYVSAHTNMLGNHHPRFWAYLINGRTYSNSFGSSSSTIIHKGPRYVVSMTLLPFY